LLGRASAFVAPPQEGDAKLLGDCFRNLLLHREDVLQTRVVTLRPPLAAVRRIHKLHAYPDAVAGLANAALEDIRDSQASPIARESRRSQPETGVEELINVPSIHELRVIGRNSSFRFKGKAEGETRARSETPCESRMSSRQRSQGRRPRPDKRAACGYGERQTSGGRRVTTAS